MSALIMNEINLLQLLVLSIIFISMTQGQLCTLQFLPALQIITMREDLQPGQLVARLQITGSSTEISTRLVYNSSEVKTNGTDYFTLNSTSLYLKYSLNYEWWTANNQPNPFRFIVACTIIATQVTNNIDFQLDLLDVNDNPPNFTQSIYNLNIYENLTVGTIISTSISATDADSGVNGLFTYYLSNSSIYASYFQLVNATDADLILVKALDYNSMPSDLTLIIIAQDRGSPSLSSNATIHIHLIDVDNLPPVFNSTFYNLNISIDTLVGSQVTPNQGQIFAYDQDRGINATIIYAIVTSNIYFSINSSTGVLTLQTEFNSTMSFNLLITATQADNPSQSATTILYVNVYEIDLYPPKFSSISYTIIGYTRYTNNLIPTINGTVNDNDTNPRLSYSYTCVNSSLNLYIQKLSLRQFQIQLIYYQKYPICQACLCSLNVSDGFYSSQSNLTVFLYTPISFSQDLYLFSADYPLNNPSIIIGSIQTNNDNRCSVQYFLNSTYNSLFSISSFGNITWSNPSIAPIQETYQMILIAQQICSSLILNRSTTIFIAINNFPSIITTSTSSSSHLDNSTIYAIIASVGAFILIVIAVLFIIIYYKIQRAKHRVPPFFNIHKHSPAQGLAFLKSKSPLSDSSPYTLGVRDDDSSNSTTSDQTISSPLNNRLLSGHYKVNEPPPVNTTIEELLSSYDNRSTSSSSNSSGFNDHIGSFRTTIRETNDHTHLDTINEDMQWVNNHSQQQRRVKHVIIPEDSMDIISESHESSISGIGNDIGGVSALLHQQSNTRPILSRNLNEYLTVFV